MLFVQFRFLIFFLIVLGVHWALRSNTARKVWLLACSHFFYACLFLGGENSAAAEEFPLWTFYHLVKTGQPLPAGWWFPAVLWGSTIMDFAVGLGIAGARTEGRRKAWLFVSLLVNLGVLAFFKYFNFFVGSAGSFLH